MAINIQNCCRLVVKYQFCFLSVGSNPEKGDFYVDQFQQNINWLPKEFGFYSMMHSFKSPLKNILS